MRPALTLPLLVVLAGFPPTAAPARTVPQSRTPSARHEAVFPVGTGLAIRFVHSLKSGRDSIGTVFVAQTLEPLASEQCVLVEPYQRVAGRVVVSRRGRMFGGSGALGLRFDSLEVGRDRWIAMEGVLDTLEYTPNRYVKDSGVVYGGRASLTRRAVPAGILTVADVAALPTFLVGGYWLARRGPAAKIVSGEVARIRLTEPLRLGVAHCGRGSGSTEPVAGLPEFTPWSEPRNGRGAGDQMNVVLLGNGRDIDNAFRRAGWVGPAHGSLGSVTHEIVAGITNHPAVGAPISSQYFQGRRQDLAYQLAGPTAKSRHHIRLWALDELRATWVATANEDAGFSVNPFKGRFTHHIRPEIDTERERVIKELEATGCATLVDRVVVPGAVLEGRNASGQRFVTDGRTAVLTIRRCETENSVAERR